MKIDSVSTLSCLGLLLALATIIPGCMGESISNSEASYGAAGGNYDDDSDSDSDEGGNYGGGGQTGSTGSTNSGGSTGSSGSSSQTQLTWLADVETIFRRDCTSCHSWASSYDKVVNKIEGDGLESRVASGHNVGGQDQDDILTWINEGYPL